MSSPFLDIITEFDCTSSFNSVNILDILLVTDLQFEAVGYQLDAQNARARGVVLLPRKRTSPLSHINRHLSTAVLWVIMSYLHQ